MQSQKFESEFHPERRSLLRQPLLVQRLLVQRLLVQRLLTQRLLAASIAVLGTIVAEAAVLSVQAASLTNWSFDPTANQLEITVKDGTTPRYFLMAQPARIVVDLPDTAVGDVSAQKNYSGAVRQIRVSQFEPGLTRIVMEISPGVSLASGQVKLQKIGDAAARSGNARWVLQPLITKALSANAVTVKPPAPAQPAAPRTLSGSGAVKPSTASPTIVTTVAPAVASKTPMAQPQPSATLGKVASQSIASDPNSRKPAIAASPSAAVNPTTAAGATDGSADPQSVVPDGTAAPATAVTLAPVLPAPQALTPSTTTPLPPVLTSSVDSNVAVDTQSGVAIAVPTPTTLATTVSSPDGAALQPSVAAPTKPIDTQPPATVKPNPATVASRLPLQLTAAPSAVAPSAVAPNLPPLEIPTTLAAASFAPAPTVSVPPLSAPGLPSSSVPAQRNQPDAAVEAPPDNVPVSTPFQPHSTAQPSVSVPPLIRVGTPNLGLPAVASPVVQSPPPPSVFSPNATLTPPVEVPPLQATIVQPGTVQPGTVQPGNAPIVYDAITVRRQPASSANLAPPLNSVPLAAPLQPPVPTVSASPGYDATTVRQSPTSAAPTSSIVEFGQPLPATSSNLGIGQPLSSLPNASVDVRQTFKPAAPNVLLPAGTTLNLRYPGNSTLTLKAESPQQEILVLLTELRDVSGNLLAPAGSTVTGRFETTTSGSQFVTQAIVVAGRTVPLAAQSDALDGARKVEGNNLARNSGIGVLAGGVLGALSGSVGLGALGGAAAGAATTLLTAPKPAIIQPGQVVQVRLTQDLRSAK